MLQKLRDKLKWLDPFTYVDLYVMPVVNPKKNEHIELAVDIIFAFIFAFVLYNYVLAFLLGAATPLVIVYSGSMEPVLYRGDVVVLSGSKDIAVKEISVDFPVKGRLVSEYAQVVAGNYLYTERAEGIIIGGRRVDFDNSGPVVVYRSSLSGLDIIHRAVLKINAPDGSFLFTYGDNGRTNWTFDADCPSYDPVTIIGGKKQFMCITLTPVQASELKGKYIFHIPLVGYVKLLIFDDLPRFLFGN